MIKYWWFSGFASEVQNYQKGSFYLRRNKTLSRLSCFGFFACQNFRPALLFHFRIRLEYSLMHDIREGQHTALRLYQISKRWFCPQFHCSLVWHRQSDLVVNNALSLSKVKWFQWRFSSSGLLRCISTAWTNWGIQAALVIRGGYVLRIFRE